MVGSPQYPPVGGYGPLLNSPQIVLLTLAKVVLGLGLGLSALLAGSLGILMLIALLGLSDLVVWLSPGLRPHLLLSLNWQALHPDLGKDFWVEGFWVEGSWWRIKAALVGQTMAILRVGSRLFVVIKAWPRLWLGSQMLVGLGILLVLPLIAIWSFSLGILGLGVRLEWHLERIVKRI
jgi:hypothetical protein